MSSNTTGAFQGFSVVQPFLGASLQWLPALGTQELDDMINAFLPGPSSIQDKRAHISMDFFEYSRLTGENFKFYPVPTASSFSSAATSSPASSAPVYDSGYSSNCNISPVIAESQWVESPSTFTPVAFDETSIRSPGFSSTSKRTAPSSSKQRTSDLANHPGMRIMTKDGRDVTNSASRGCKTKEQRDHAHLMRIIKACDSCRKKKIRCDPSHKKRTASQASASPVEQKSSKKSKKKAAAADPPPSSTNELSLDLDLDLLNNECFDISEFTFPTIETTPESVNDLWGQYVQQDPTLFTNDFLGYVPDDYSLFTDHQLSHVSPSSGSSSTSPSQVYTPYTPTPPGPSPPTVVYENVPEVSQGDPTLPYLNPDVPHGTDYVDFNLFSPPPDFLLDEEPQPVKKTALPGRRQRSTESRSPVSGYETLDNVSASSSAHNPQADGLVHSQPPGPLQSSSPGLLRVSQFSTQALEMIASPATVFHDYSPAAESPVSQTSRGPDQQQYIDRPHPGLESYEPFYGVRATVSRSEQPGVIVQSTVTAPVRRTAGLRDITVSPSLAIATSPSAIVSTTLVAAPTENPQAHVNSPHGLPGVPGVSASQTINRRRGVELQASVSPVTVQTVDNAGVGPSPPANVSVSVPGPFGNGQLVQSRHGVQQQGLVPSGVDVGSSLNTVVATTLLSTLPVRRLLAGGVSSKPGQPSSLACSQLVVLGLVSYLLVCLVGAQQYMGSFHDLVNTLFMITTVSLTVLTATQNKESPRTATIQPSSSASLVENVKSRVQAAGCQIRQRAVFFTRRISLPRLASVNSLHGRF